MNKKILSMIIAASMISSSAVVFAEDEPAVVDNDAVLISDTIDATDEGIMLISEEAVAEDEAIEIAPSFVNFEALKVVAVDGEVIETVDAEENTVFVNTHKSMFFNIDGTEIELKDLKAGDELSIFVRANEPTPLVLPAEYTPAVIVKADAEYAGSVAVDTFIPNTDGEGYINTTGTLVIHLPEDFVTNKRIDNDYIVFYSRTTMSIPPQAPADKVVLLPAEIVEEETEEVAGETVTEGKKFADVADDAAYAQSVYDVVERGLFNGVSETEFMPGGNMTRAMFVTVLGRLDGFAVKDAMPTGFSDTPGDQYYSSYVVWANENGIVKGYEDGTFRPDNQVTREEAMQIIWNYCAYKGMTPEEGQAWATQLPYKDAARMSGYAVNAGMWNAIHNYFTVDGEENIRPTENATRAEVACAMNVLAGEIEK